MQGYDGYGKCHKSALLIVVLLFVFLAALLPVSAQAGTLYLPAVANGRDWFEQRDFEWALTAAGYDAAAVLIYTWCELDDMAEPPALIRYSRCYLDLTPDTDQDATWVVFWWRGDIGRMWWAVEGL